jgi:hypothetical protein
VIGYWLVSSRLTFYGGSSGVLRMKLYIHAVGSQPPVNYLAGRGLAVHRAQSSRVWRALAILYWTLWTPQDIRPWSEGCPWPNCLALGLGFGDCSCLGFSNRDLITTQTNCKDVGLRLLMTCNELNDLNGKQWPHLPKRHKCPAGTSMICSDLKDLQRRQGPAETSRT